MFEQLEGTLTFILMIIMTRAPTPWHPLRYARSPPPRVAGTGKLIQLVQERTYSLQRQDQACEKCKTVSKRNMATRCPKCAGRFAPRRRAKGCAASMSLLNSLADFYHFPHLKEVVSFWL